MNNKKKINRNDKRIYESRKLLKDALIKLLETKDLEHISVTELSKLSGVSRATYYRNHNSLEEILLKHMRDWYMNTFSTIVLTGGAGELSYRLFKECETELNFFKAIVKCKLDYAVIMELKSCIESLLSDKFAKHEAELVPLREFFYQAYPYSTYAFAGHGHATLLYWIDHPELSAREITQYFDGYVN